MAEKRDKALKHASNCGKAERDLAALRAVTEEMAALVENGDNEMDPQWAYRARAVLARWQEMEAARGK